MTATLDRPPTAPGPPDHGSGPRPSSTPVVVARVVLLLGGSLLALMMVAVTTLVVAGVLVRTSESADDTVTGPITGVEVDVAGSVTVRPGPPGRVRIVRRSDFSFTRPKVTRELRAGVLHLEVGCEGIGVICDHRIELTVPAGAALDLRSHRVVVRDTSGPVVIDTDGGSVELAGVSGPVTARVDGGSIRGRDISATDVRLSAGAGSIEVAFTRPPSSVSATAGAGHVELVLPRDPTAYRVEADAGAGDSTVSVRTDPESSRVVRAQAGAGEVIVRYGPA